MKLEVLSTDNCQSTRTGEPRIRLNVKSGTFNINKYAAEKIGIKTGERILIYFDPEETQHYIARSGAENAFAPRQSSDKNGFLFNNSALVKTIAERHKVSENFNLAIGPKVEESEIPGLFPLLYSKSAK